MRRTTLLMIDITANKNILGISPQGYLQGTTLVRKSLQPSRQMIQNVLSWKQQIEIYISLTLANPHQPRNQLRPQMSQNRFWIFLPTLRTLWSDLQFGLPLIQKLHPYQILTRGNLQHPRHCFWFFHASIVQNTPCRSFISLPGSHHWISCIVDLNDLNSFKSFRNPASSLAATFPTMTETLSALPAPLAATEDPSTFPPSGTNFCASTRPEPSQPQCSGRQQLEI